jgi:hypothetical protein
VGKDKHSRFILSTFTEAAWQRLQGIKTILNYPINLYPSAHLFTPITAFADFITKRKLIRKNKDFEREIHEFKHI